MTNASENGTAVLAIEGEMTIYRALELKQALLDGLEKAASLELDLSRVTELDSTGVQLLLLTGKAAQAAKRQLRVIAQSPAVLDVRELLNLAADFCPPCAA